MSQGRDPFSESSPGPGAPSALTNTSHSAASVPSERREEPDHAHSDAPHRNHSYEGHTGSGHNLSDNGHSRHSHAGHGHAGHSHAGHSHAGHGHSHGPANYNRAFAIGVTLNLAFVLVEASFGIISGSMALVADAGHNLSDVLSLLIAWGAATLAARPASSRFTYGFKNSTILAALTNAVLLLVAIGAILIESLRRLFEPAAVEGWTMIAVASVGVLINAGTAVMFMKDRAKDINIRGAYLHMAADALVSVGVVAAGAAILLTNIAWIDPVTSLIIVAVIGWGTWGLLKDSVKMSLLAVPDSVDRDSVLAYLQNLPGVAAVHDLHIWPMSTTETALTAHLEIPSGHPGDSFLQQTRSTLAAEHNIGHATLQIEQSRDCGGHC